MTTTRFSARTRISTLNASACRSPLAVFQDLAGRAAAEGSARTSCSSVLMESVAQGSPGGTRSLVVPSGVVRLIARGRDVSFDALSPQGARLLPALGAYSRFPHGAGAPSLPDDERLRAPTVLDAVRALANLVEDEEPKTALPPGVYGAFSYELVDCWEDLPPRPAARCQRSGHEPDINVVLALDTILFDHLAGEVQVVTRSLDRSEDALRDRRHQRFVEALTRGASSRNDGRNDGGNDDVPLPAVSDQPAKPDVSDEEFLRSVEKFLHHIECGDIFQGVLSRGLEMKSRVDPLTVYRVLRKQNPSPYMFHVDLGDGILLGASPETCLKVEGRRVEIRPIAGTAPRGFSEDGTPNGTIPGSIPGSIPGLIDVELDSRLAIGLLLDTKEQAEHAMLVDLARNDVARVAIPGTRRVAEPFTIEKYSHVQHLVSGVFGELRPELDALHAYRAVANMGTLTGAPKLRAMELIRETEPYARGFYGGAVGYLLQDGSFDSCIVIRSLRYRKNGSYSTRAGAGIVADSIPERELEETVHKARACRQAVAIAEACS